MTQIVVGQILNASQINVLEINYPDKESQFKIMDLVELPDLGLNCLIIGGEDCWAALGDSLDKYQHLYPVVDAEDFNIERSIEDLQETEVIEIVQSITSKWVLHNNLVSLEEIFDLKEHLKQLFNGDRNTFFEEFWYFIKRNLGTSELTIIFNDVLEVSEKDEKKGDRPKLVQSYIKGIKSPEFYTGENKEEKIMQHFSDSIVEPFEVSDFNKEKKQLTALASINGSPLIIMAETLEINQLQESLFKSIFNGLQG
jgi:hypothetical protein